MGRRVVALGALLFGCMLAAFSAPIARAVDQTVLGKAFVVKDPPPGVDDSMRSVVAVGKELLSDDSLNGNPLLNGATIQIIANGNISTQQVFTLPPGAYASGSHGWKSSGKPVVGYTYKDPLGQIGPVKAASIKKSSDGTFVTKAALKGALGPGPQPHITVVPPAPGTDGGMIFQINAGDTYCVNFGGPASGAITNSPTKGTPNKVFKIVSNKVTQTTEAGCPLGGISTTTVTSTSSSTTSSTTSTSTSVTTSTFTSTTSTSTSSTTSTTNGVVCGNGVVEGIEECDDGNEDNSDACTSHCTIARCGDGIVHTGVEQCDDGNATPNDGCTNCVLDPPVCGNGLVEAGETCDDGNTLDGDSCPANCRIEPCTPTATRVNVRVSFARPNGVTVGALTVFLDYPDGRISIPGSGSEATAIGRISNTPLNFSSAPFDLDYAIRETIAAFNRTLSPGAIFDIGFDLCAGATAPKKADFTCSVEQASTPQGVNITPLTGITCSVSIL